MMQEGQWQGYFVYENGYYPMIFEEAEIQVDPPGTFRCKGNDRFGTFEMQGSFYMTYCIIKKQYSEDHFFRYIGQVFYPPLWKQNPLPQNSQQRLNQFKRQIDEIQKGVLFLHKEYNEKHQPIKQVQIMGIYELSQGIYGGVFCLTFVPKNSIKEQKVVDQEKFKLIHQKLMVRARQLAHYVQIAIARKK